MTDAWFQRTALVVVDMQRYYLEPESSFARYHKHFQPGCLDWISTRAWETVVPNVQQLLSWGRERGCPIVYLRLCGKQPDRQDLHPTFRKFDLRGRARGFPDMYPLESDPMSDVVAPIAPLEGDLVFCKTTFSGFTSSPIDAALRERGIDRLVFSGLATSQCVETTARDASDRGYDVIHLEDAQTDYDHATHQASLHSSRGVCGGAIYATRQFMARAPVYLR